CMQSTKDPRTF
nr:immunoglobulin light chain junction region [Macaca mulatta]MOV35150.1 immunoglobulin light chain junction region [Macaca mulatta]MOV83152.1 immunoglobulin light chain junction region [Macaca mulatta]MOV83247.1 immunoglobulin light chain junction region [Macaca mulatta]MOW39679.1 immunoglobulin light chain junction region [Macaca mulatta]